MKKVLIVDDESHILWMIEARLKGNSYETAIAYGGKEGLEKARAFRPDAILLDIMMPGFNGFVTLSALKADPATSMIPVIMFTGKDRIEDVQKAIALGAIDYIMKPFKAEDLLEKVRLVVGK